MKPAIAIFDDFLPPQVLHEAERLKFGRVLNPVDNVTYEGIALELPEALTHPVWVKLTTMFGPIKVRYQFARLMTESTPPSEIHSDLSMAEFTCHNYLTKYPGDNYGTQFWTHEDFGDSAWQELEYTFDMIDRLKTPELWAKSFMVKGRYNRALIHDAGYWHSATPSRGFGKDASDGRLVMTTFFNRSST